MSDVYDVILVSAFRNERPTEKENVWLREWKMDFEIGDIVKLKKKHPCGSQEWEVLRVGADFRLKCAGCGHQIMVPRKLVEKNVRAVKKA